MTSSISSKNRWEPSCSSSGNFSASAQIQPFFEEEKLSFHDTETSHSLSAVTAPLGEKKLLFKEENIPSKNAFLRQLLGHLSTSNSQQAIKALFRVLDSVSGKDSLEDLEKIYQCVFHLLHEFEIEDIVNFEREDTLDTFLSVSKTMKENQARLSYLLGKKHEQIAIEQVEEKQKAGFDHIFQDFIRDYNETFLYYAKAISVMLSCKGGDSSLLSEIYKKISEVFVEIIRARLKETFAKALSNLSDEKFEETLDEIKSLKKFCFRKAQIESFYNVASDSISDTKNPKVKGKFKTYNERINEELNLLDAQENSVFLNNITQTYKESLAQFRQNFTRNIENTREFQKMLSEEFKIFFQEVFIRDVFAILGPPPCNYDIRAMGSIGKEEMCPYSDLEYFILIDDSKLSSQQYFKDFAMLLRLQMILLDETPDLKIVFKCFQEKNFSGFKVDSGGNPALDERLISSPLQMSQIIKPELIQPNSIENTIMKSISLQSSGGSLFESYQTLLLESLNKTDGSVLGSLSKGKEIALKLMKERLRVYKELNPSVDLTFLQGPVDVKSYFLEPVAHLLRDLSIYFGCPETNTQDIVDALVKKQVVTHISGFILKESLSNLYKIRIRLHLESKHQNEFWNLFVVDSSVSKEDEKRQLEKMHLVVLRPFYLALSRALQNEGEFETIFQNVDLIQEGFNELSGQLSRNSFVPFIKHAVETLIENNALEAAHLHFYNQLSLISDTERLREAYLEVLEKKSPDVLNKLADISSLDGLRQSYLRREKSLQTAIQAITTEEDTGVQIQWGSQSKASFLSRACIYRILDGKGDIKNSYPGSMHRVAKLENPQELHFKQFPSQPLMEYAIGNLYARLAGLLTPAVELVCFTVKVGAQVKRYPVLISQTIKGLNLKDVFGTNSINNARLSSINWDRWSQMLLCSILSLPGDGRLSNFVLDQKNELWCIDNDISFVEPLVQEGFQGKKINFCSALFCGFQERPLSKEALESFCSHDPGVLLNSWLFDVIKKDHACQNLFTDEENEVWLNQEISFKPAILLREGMAATLNLQFWRLQSYIKICLKKNQTITALDLLGQIISLRKNLSIENPTGRFIASMYQKKAQKKGSVDQILARVVARSVEQSLTSFQSDKACLEKPPTMEDLKKRSLFSPEKAREELHASMISQVFSEKQESIYTGSRNQKEVLQGSFKDLSEARQKIVIQSLSHFIALSSAKPKVIILQHCDVLDSFALPYFLHKDLEYLDLRFCKKIQGSDVELIALSCPRLKELYIMHAPELKSVKGKATLRPIIAFSELEVLKISGCDNLTQIYIAAPLLRTYFLRNNSKLAWIDCSSIPIHKVDFGWSGALAEHVFKEFGKKHGINTPNLRVLEKRGELRAIWACILDKKSYGSVNTDLYDRFEERIEFLFTNGVVFNDNLEMDKILFFLIQRRFEVIIKLMLEKYPKINEYVENIELAVRMAAKEGNVNIVNLLISRRSNFNSKHDWLSLALIGSIEGSHLDFSNALIEKGADVNYDYKGTTPLIAAIDAEEVDNAQFLLDWGADANRKNLYGSTALFIAVERGKKHHVEFLLKNDADVNSKNRQGETTLLTAVDCSDDEMVNILLKHGAWINYVNIDGDTALTKVARSGSNDERLTRIIESLLKNGSQFDHVNHFGCTALKSAIYARNKEIIQLLVKRDPELTTAYGNLGYSLILAAIYGDVKNVSLLLMEGAGVNSQNEAGDTPLIFAVIRGDEKIVTLLLSRGAAINHQNVKRCTALTYAIMFDHFQIVEILLEKVKEQSSLVENSKVVYQNIDLLSVLGDIALIYDAMRKNTKNAELLIKYEVELGHCNAKRDTFLILAARNGDVDLVELLINKGASRIDHQSGSGTTALAYAAMNGHVKIADLLLKAGAKIDHQDENGDTPLTFAARQGHVKVVELLLKEGAKIDHQNENRNTPLTIAAGNDLVTVVELLLKEGAKIDHQNENGNTPLTIAAKNGHVANVELLLKEGAKVDHQNKNGNTPLTIAVQEGRVKIVELLLKERAKIDHQNVRRNTALRIAALEGHVKVVEFFLKEGAEIDHQDEKGHTALMLAAEKGHIGVVDFLLKVGAKIDLQNTKGNTALMSASFRRHKEIVEILIKNGASINCSNSEGKSALTFAFEVGHKEIEEILMQNGATID